jgi:hypothetical protein
MKQKDAIFQHFGLVAGASFDLVGIASLTGMPYDDLKRIYYAAAAAATPVEVAPKMILATGKWKSASTKTPKSIDTAAMKAVYIYIYDIMFPKKQKEQPVESVEADLQAPLWRPVVEEESC